jgi:hypothetical protein
MRILGTEKNLFVSLSDGRDRAPWYVMAPCWPVFVALYVRNLTLRVNRAHVHPHETSSYQKREVLAVSQVRIAELEKEPSQKNLNRCNFQENTMLTKIVVASLISLPMLMACGTTSQAPVDDSAIAANAQKTPSPDANVAVRQFVNAHAEVMGGIAEIKSANRGMKSDLEVIKTTSQKSLETAQSSLKIIEEMANLQGTGELSVFFPNGSAQLAPGSMEHERLVRFADFLARESKGRKVILLSIGSASAYGKEKVNMNLAVSAD